jgi:hypothetical protein
VRNAIDQLGRVITLLRAMDEKLDPAPPQPSRPVSTERCEQVRSRVLAWAARADLAPPDAPECTVLVRMLEGGSYGDAELLLEVVRRAWVDPWAAKHRRETGDLVALIGGRIAPASHRLAATIAATNGIGDAAAARLAHEQARRAACLAATALWVHAQFDDDARLRVLLEQDCPERPAEVWIGEAIARPRRSLQGLGLAFIEPGPAALAALERYAWAPLGLVHVLADPRSVQPAAPTPLRIQWEELQP